MAAFQSVFLFIISLLIFIARVQGQGKIFNVQNYGAKADGKTDNNKAFLDAWTAACDSGDRNVVLIPQGTFLVGPVNFTGPCKGPIKFLIKGVVKAPSGAAMLNLDHWIIFRYIHNFVLTGGGVFDGQGPSAWPYNTCQKSLSCKQLPISIRFDFVTNAWIHHITSIDSKNFHLDIFQCHNMQIEKIRISAPADSPNTDGIHIGSSTYINVINSDIATGDDCISMGPGAKQIIIAGVKCGPGHGISIGSLGKFPEEDDVLGLTVKNCSFDGTTNGVRIKTWAPSGKSVVKNVTFEDIQMKNADNPIIIDQQYCPSHLCEHDKKSSSRVRIEEVRFRNIWGTSSREVAVNLDCSGSTPCEKIELRDINIEYSVGGGKSTSYCKNVNGVAYGKQDPPSCL